MLGFAERGLERLFDGEVGDHFAADLTETRKAVGDGDKILLIEFGNVLIAQRSLLSLQDQLAVSEGGVTSNLIALYKSLGGGWKSLMPDNTN